MRRVGRVRRRRPAFDLEVGEPLEPLRQVPVALAEQAHGGGDEQQADERRVERERDGDAEAHLLEGDELAGGEAAEDDDDDRRGAGDQARGGGHAVDDRAGGVAGGAPALVDAAEQEHLVVHREPEQHAEQEDGDPRVDALDLREAQQIGPDALLEDEHEDPVGGADGEQVDRDRGQRDRDRPEREQQEHEAQRQHEDDHDRQPAAVDREVVARLGRCAADEDAVRRRAERARDVLLAEPVDGGRRACAGRFDASAARRRR